MRLETYRSPELCRQLAEQIAALAGRLGRTVSVMEVCGTHTMAIARCGLRSLLPGAVSVPIVVKPFASLRYVTSVPSQPHNAQVSHLHVVLGRPDPEPPFRIGLRIGAPHGRRN
ncbi:MAG: hypothetical protein ABSE73_32520 [Planctomycetota bacterium]